MNNSLHGYNVDFFYFGVIIYYLIKYVNIINLIEIFINHIIIKNYSSSCINFVNELLISDNKQNKVFKDINELKIYL